VDWSVLERRETEAQQRIVEMVLPEGGPSSKIRMQRSGPNEQLGTS
jgi:hypothetical protein